MASTIPYPLINGVRHAWASVEIKIDKQIYYATAINYSRKRNRTLVRVNHPDPVGKTRGSNEYTGDVEVLLAEYNLIQQALIALANAQNLNGGYGDVPFQIVVTYSENGLDTITDTLQGCTMDSTESSNTEGTEPSKRKFDCAPLKVLFGGQDDLATPLQAPTGT